VTAVHAPRYADRVAVVTGAARGIGLATARRLGAEGARLLIADLDEAKAVEAAKACEAAGSPGAFARACDVSREADVQGALDAALSRFSRLDLVVNNAGLMVIKPLVEQTEDDWLRILRVDLLGAFFFTRHAFSRMRHGGAIVNVSSIHAIETTPNVASYAAAKAALVSLTRSASLEGKPLGIRVNCVLPGAVDTPMLWSNPNLASGLETVKPADVGKPDDVAAAIAWLGSDDAAFVQGASLRVDGGRLDRL
jgi:NAD(P)-dependent dehydrogenase (short-subunit alcohol dehydrogenase family)